MPDNGSTQATGWPLPKFYFSVDLGDGYQAPFQEVSGLEAEAPATQYPTGDKKTSSTIKMPGIGKVGNVTLKKGVFSKDAHFWDWYQSIKMNTVERRTMTISIFDEAGSPAMTWTLQKAFPIKITATELKSYANEVAVEAIEIGYETLTVKRP